MLHSSPYQKYIPPGILALALLTVYLFTLAPGLTWANAGADGGDLITAAYMGGVAHPTGYPVYLLLARFFQFLPVGSLAFRTNLMSALATVSAAVLLYLLVTRQLAPADSHRWWPVGLISGFAFGLSPLVWSQAVITEVYALQSLFAVLVLYLSTDAGLPGKNADRLRGLTLGLAMGNHLTTIFLVPAAILLNVVHRPPSVPPQAWRLDWKSLLRQMTYLAVGLLAYLILPLRAASNPVVNWGDPVTFGRFWWLISGELYQGSLLPPGAGEIWVRLQVSISVLVEQFGSIALAIAFVGLVFFFRPARLYFFTLYLLLTSVVFSGMYGSFDSYIYLIPAVLSFSIWIGLGMEGLMRSTHRYGRQLAWGVALLLVLSLSSTLPRHWGQVDASRDLRAENFGAEVLAAAPANAIVFARGDRAVFALWYFHFALHERPDLVVIATDLLHFDWYQETLRSTYPALVLPGPFPWPETVMDANPLVPACFVEYTGQTIMDCSPPEDGH
jgi:hypothetical protein